jgi:hypothetical protein
MQDGEEWRRLSQHNPIWYERRWVVVVMMIAYSHNTVTLITAAEIKSLNIQPWPTQSPIQWVIGALSPGRQADHAPPSSAEIKN